LTISSLTTFGLTVTNAGNGPAGPFSVTVCGIGSFDFTGLAPGASSQASWKTCIAGTTTATVDPKNAVGESNETNNTASLEHGCRPGPREQPRCSQFDRYACPYFGVWRSLVSALVWGTRGPRFESGHPD
jgi:hypothetical protein